MQHRLQFQHQPKARVNSRSPCSVSFRAYNPKLPASFLRRLRKTLWYANCEFYTASVWSKWICTANANFKTVTQSYISIVRLFWILQSHRAWIFCVSKWRFWKSLLWATFGKLSVCGLIGWVSVLFLLNVRFEWTNTKGDWWSDLKSGLKVTSNLQRKPKSR